ncbi:DUF1186 domain-containing protein [Kallotenue papyrolyticum]|uniref:DUF1186 domain-containing protein n=1 Tax=Kallotenue papyrolyticum TaxID=1325125 RepID=UPI0004785965|nr:DUF1186 domain-containing protein [Kallotenue papyrolyticum]
MPMETPLDDLVRQLRRIGLRPTPRLITGILEHGAAAIPALLELALDVDRLREAEPASLGPLHALRLLGELPAAHSTTAILERLPLPLDDQPPTQAAYLWAQEAPQIIARWGADALPHVLAVAGDETAPAVRRGAAYAALSYLVATTPELRAQVIATLRERLERDPDPTARGYAVAALAQLADREAYATIMRLYREQQIDREIISAADARQLLLGTGGTRQLECARHTLDERYEQHGPYSEEQRRAMAEMMRQGSGVA